MIGGLAHTLNAPSLVSVGARFDGTGLAGMHLISLYEHNVVFVRTYIMDLLVYYDNAFSIWYALADNKLF